LPPNGVIRYGFKTTDIRLFNTIYAEWVWDNNVLDLCYDTLIGSNPYALTQRLPWSCANYTVGSYLHPVYGTCTKVTFTLRNDVTWTDGAPVTVKDVYFTLVELDDLLAARGLPKPWWVSAVKSILSFTIMDPYTFEILINIKSIWAFGLTGAGVRLMPEHIWRPIIASASASVIQGATPEVNMITSGPWRFREYVSTSYVDLVANKPGRIVKTSFAGSVNINSTYGYFRYSPISVDIKVNGGYSHKFGNCTHTLTVTLANEWYGGPVTVDKTIKITFKNGTTVTLATATGISIPAKPGKHSESFTFCWPYGNHTVEVSYSVTSSPWAGYSRTQKSTYWVTIKEDIAGAIFLGDIAPDIKVDIQDVARVSGAFGSYPGHPRWSSICDVSGDYKVDIQDLARTAAKFGWHG